MKAQFGILLIFLILFSSIGAITDKKYIRDKEAYTFQVEDEIVIVEGMYRHCRGTIIDVYRTPNEQFLRYNVHLKCGHIKSLRAIVREMREYNFIPLEEWERGLE